MMKHIEMFESEIEKKDKKLLYLISMFNNITQGIG